MDLEWLLAFGLCASVLGVPAAGLAMVTVAILGLKRQIRQSARRVAGRLEALEAAVRGATAPADDRAVSDVPGPRAPNVHCIWCSSRYHLPYDVRATPLGRVRCTRCRMPGTLRSLAA